LEQLFERLIERDQARVRAGSSHDHGPRRNRIAREGEPIAAQRTDRHSYARFCHLRESKCTLLEVKIDPSWNHLRRSVGEHEVSILSARNVVAALDQSIRRVVAFCRIGMPVMNAHACRMETLVLREVADIDTCGIVRAEAPRNDHRGPVRFFILDGNQIVQRHFRHDNRQTALQVSHDFLRDDDRLLAVRND
jgi:hypothetical protein